MDDVSAFWMWAIALAVFGAALGWDIAKRKGLDKRGWAAACFFFPPAVIGLAFARSQQRPGLTEAFRARWASLAAYDPDIKAAVARMEALGPAAVEQFRLAYADVQTKEAVPLIVEDLERRWAAGDRFDGTQARSQRLDELYRQGRLSDHDYAEQTRRLRERRSRPPWVGWWWKAPVALALLWLVWPHRSGSVSGLPTCAAAAARELVRSAIEGADDSRSGNRRLLDLTDLEEVSFDASARERLCAGSALLNLGERHILFRLTARDERVFVNVAGF